MSLTLGEKLRQAREDRGLTVSEVADQTRISPHYLECIENDDYHTLPGGIFNKGFVKSYAKFVGINEQEALSDYSSLASRGADPESSELKVYRPEVLTDDRSGSSMIPTAITAVVILGIMTAGILFLVNYLRRPSEPTAVTSLSPANVANSEPASDTKPANPSGAPEMGTVKIEFKAVGQPVRLIATVDGIKNDNVVAAGNSATFEPKESLILNYNRWNAGAVQLTINGKTIATPADPINGAADKGRIEFTIGKDNLAQIWSNGSVSGEVATAPPVDANINANTNANVVAPVATAPVQPRTTPAANLFANKPATANAAAKPTPDTSKPAKTPAPTPAKTVAAPKPTANN